MPSSVVAAIQYEKEKSVLRIIFISGMVYEYGDVPEAIYLQMKAARSKGKFLNDYIKGNYVFKKIKD